MDLSMSQDRATARQRKRAADSHADGIDKRIQHDNNVYTPVAPHRDLGFDSSRDPPPVNERYASEQARSDRPSTLSDYIPPHHPYSMQNCVHVRLPLQPPNSNHEAMVTPALKTHIAHTQPRYQPVVSPVPARHESGPFIGGSNGPAPMGRMNPGATLNPALSNTTGPIGYQQASFIDKPQPLAQKIAQLHPELRADLSRKQGFYQQQQPPQGCTAQQPSQQIGAQQLPQQVGAQQPQQDGHPNPEEAWGALALKQLQSPYAYVPGIPLEFKMPHPEQRPLLLPYDFLLARHLEPKERYLRYLQYHSVLATCYKSPSNFRYLAQALSRKLQVEEYRLLRQWYNEKSESQRLQSFTKQHLLNDLQLGPEVIAISLEHFQPNTPANQEIIIAAQKLLSVGLPGALQDTAEPAPGYHQPPGLYENKGTKKAPIMLDEDEDEPVKTTYITRLDGMNPAAKRGSPTATATTPKVPRKDAYNKPVDTIVVSDDVDKGVSFASVSGPVRAPAFTPDPVSAPSRGQAPGLAPASGTTSVPGPVRSPHFFSSSQSGPTPDSGSTPLDATTPNTEASIDPDSVSAPASAPKFPQGPAKVLDNQNFQDWTAKWTHEKAIVGSTLPGNLSKQLLAAVNSGRFKFRSAWEAYVATEEAQRNKGKVQQQAAARIQARKEARRAVNKAYKDRIRGHKKRAAEPEEEENEEHASEAVAQVNQQGVARKDRQQKQQKEQQQESQNENVRYVNKDLVEDALLLLNDEAEEGSPAPDLIGEPQTVEADQEDLLQDALAFLEEESENSPAPDDNSSQAKRASEGTEVEGPSRFATGLPQENLQPQSPGDAFFGSVEKDSLAEDSDEDLGSLFGDDEEFVASATTPVEKARATEDSLLASNEDQDIDSLFVDNGSEPTTSSTKPFETVQAIEEEPVVFLESGLADATEEKSDDRFEDDEEESEASSIAPTEEVQAVDRDSASDLAENTEDDYNDLFDEEDDETIGTIITPPNSPQKAHAKEAAISLGFASPNPTVSVDIQTQTAEQEDAELTPSNESDESDVSDADDPDSELEEEEERDPALEEERAVIAGMHAQIANWQHQIQITTNKCYKARLQSFIDGKNEQLRQYRYRGF